MKMKVQARLRVASHPYHVRINHHPLLVGLTGQGYPLAHYRNVLNAYFHLYREIENRIQQFAEKHSVSFDYQARSKLPWLADDLQFMKSRLGLEPISPARPVSFPEIENVAQLIGVLYPIEGSTLGGQVVSRHLEQHLGLTREKGARFFNGYAEKTAARWDEFCRFADSIGSDAAQFDSAQAATSLTFQKFEEILNEYHRCN